MVFEGKDDDSVVWLVDYGVCKKLLPVNPETGGSGYLRGTLSHCPIYTLLISDWLE